jgi:hypothetical protein
METAGRWGEGEKENKKGQNVGIASPSVSISRGKGGYSLSRMEVLRI